MATGTPFNNNNDFAQRPQFIQMNGRCPVCNHTFDFKHLNVLYEQNGATLLHITCQNCFSSTLASVVVGQGGVNFSGIVTDLNITDVMKFKEADTITNNYVMELHQTLQSNSLVF
jgi:hypothetical protein